jgi:hypothetical protein
LAASANSSTTSTLNTSAPISAHHRGLVPEPGAHLEHSRSRFDPEEVEHERTDEWLRDSLVEADRQRRVLVSHQHEALRHEQMARNIHQGPTKRLRRNIRTYLITGEFEVHVDDLDHVASIKRQVLLGHRLHRKPRHSNGCDKRAFQFYLQLDASASGP